MDIAQTVRTTHPDVVVDAGELPVVWMNPLRARELFTNLIENAVEHGRRNDLTVRVRARAADRGHVLVSVADDGVGIPMAYRERVFGIFERLDAGVDHASGTGIGLAICQKIVEQAGGTIAIVDAPAGAAFELRLPLASATAIPAAGTSGAGPTEPATTGLATGR
jgi:signal transduction histidine kinase